MKAEFRDNNLQHRKSQWRELWRGWWGRIKRIGQIFNEQNKHKCKLTLIGDRLNSGEMVVQQQGLVFSLVNYPSSPQKSVPFTKRVTRRKSTLETNKKVHIMFYDLKISNFSSQPHLCLVSANPAVTSSIGWWSLYHSSNLAAPCRISPIPSLLCGYC